MDISQRGIDLIVASEGKYKLRPDGKYQAYLDTLAKPPVWTIYCGLTKGVTKDTCVTVEEADRMFAKELAIYEDAIERLVKVALNQNQFDALVSFTYNCGVGALGGSTLLKLLNQGKYEQVPAQLMRWTHAGGKEYGGLVTRRKAEGALFMEPMTMVAVVEDDAPPQMPQRVEEVPAMSLGEAMTSSPTFKTMLLGIFTSVWWFIQTVYEFLFGVVKEAGPELLTLKTTLSPFDALLKMTPTLLIMLTTGCLVAVGIRHVVKRRAGTSV